MAALISLSDLRTSLGITGSSEDVLLASIASNASARWELDTSRRFTYASNVVRRYSTEGRLYIPIEDVPVTDATRVVTLDGAALVEGQSYWLIPDRRNPDVSVSLQLGAFGPGFWRSDPGWFDKNLDRLWARGAQPLNLEVTGCHGHPTLPGTAQAGILALGTWMFYRAKSGGSGTVALPSGQSADLSELPPGYSDAVEAWRRYGSVESV